MSGTLWKKWENYLPGVWYEGRRRWEWRKKWWCLLEGGGYPYSLVRLGSKAGSHNVTVVLQTPRPQQTCLMATVSSPDREREKAREGHGGWSEGDGGGLWKDQRGEGWGKPWREMMKTLHKSKGRGDKTGKWWERELRFRWTSVTKWRNALLGQGGSHLEQVCTCPGTETVEHSASGFLLLCFFTSLKVHRSLFGTIIGVRVHG